MKPYRLNITGALKTRKNEMEVEVVNLWRNQFIRDKQRPENENTPGQLSIKLRQKARCNPQNSGMINHNGCALVGSGNVHAVVRIGSSYKHYSRLGTK